ncbi:MAG TPA: M12 family metallo-peptidase, partial [Pyrinomonadaceae bacterium]|nr:M12 family metallo-peptidase [Pyrinomonadaceae bacterium]
MKQLGSFLCSFLKARRLFVGAMTALIAGSFTVTALMKGNNGKQVDGNKKASQAQSKNHPTADFWQEMQGTSPSQLAALSDKQIEVQPKRFRAFTLNRVAMQSALAAAPREFTAAARQGNFILSIPSPAGEFKRFAVHESPVMEPGLAAKHPDIKIYSGNGIDEAGATVRFDLTPLGFHASVRGPSGSWYIDPYYHLDQSVYVSYFRGDLDNPHGVFTESESDEALITADHSFYRVGDMVKLEGSGFISSTPVNITISDSENPARTRNLEVRSDESGSFQLKFPASTDGTKAALAITATEGANLSSTSYEVFSKTDQQPLLATGDQLRTYRLALITDPGYANYFGGPANVTAAKVTLINRVDQLYEEDISIRMVLVANNDLLNLDTWGQATGPNGPCGAAGCFTQTQVTGCASTTRARFVIGQIIGASNYDIGHLALGEPGGGVANLGVVGRSNKAGGCTGIPTPVGDFYAVDYVAHEMGHQFSGNHPFNGTQLNCSGGNRNAGASVEPGSGSSVMAYAGICLTDDLQRHSDPYFSERSQQEIATYTSGNQAAINEVQTASLRHFGGGSEIQTVTFGPGYAPASTVQPLSLAINAAPSASSLGGATESGNTVTIATGNSHTLQAGDVVTITGVAVAGYNGTFTVTAIVSSRAFQYTNPTAGLATSGGGTVTLAIPGATESGNTVTISTNTAHGRSVGDIVVIAGVGVGGYNGTFTITAVPTTRTFQYTNATAGLANSGSGTSTYSSPFQVRIGGNDSAVIGGSGQAYTNANLSAAINAISGFAGTATVSGAASTGFTVTYSGAAAGVD